MEKDFFNDIVVVKRSGQRVSFNPTKVAIAIKKGFDSVYDEYDEKLVNNVKEKVLDKIEKDYKDRKTIGVEDVQDIIEDTLKNLASYTIMNLIEMDNSKYNWREDKEEPNEYSRDK